MTKLNGADLLLYYQQMKDACCICPHCQTLQRVSDLYLEAAQNGKTWLDDYEVRKQQIEQTESKMNEKIQKLKAEATKKAHVRADKDIQQALAIGKMNYKDVLPMTNIARCIEFKGLSEGQIEEVTLYDCPPSIAHTINNGSDGVRFKTVRPTVEDIEVMEL